MGTEMVIDVYRLSWLLAFDYTFSEWEYRAGNEDGSCNNGGNISF